MGYPGGEDLDRARGGYVCPCQEDYCRARGEELSEATTDLYPEGRGGGRTGGNELSQAIVKNLPSYDTDGRDFLAYIDRIAGSGD